MNISVVIPAYNAEKTIIPCLESLVKQSFLSQEIIVVDNNSTDKTFQLVKNFNKNIILLLEMKKGPAAARNKGIKQATGEVIAFTDADCIADKDWIKNIVEAFNNKDIVGVVGQIEGYKPETLIEKFLAFSTLQPPKGPHIFEEYYLLSGGFPTTNLSFKRSVLMKLGGFNLNWLRGQDCELCARVLKTGNKIRFNSHALVYHINKTTLKGLLQRTFWSGMANARLLKKHCPKYLIFQLPRLNVQRKNFPLTLWLDFASSFKICLIFVIIGIFQSWCLLILLIYFFHLFRGIGKMLKEKGITSSIWERVVMVGLRIFNSLAMDLGRWRGSIKYRVACF